MRTRCSFLWVKRPGHEGDHSSPPSPEVKNARSYTSTPPYVFMALYLIKRTDNFNFTLPLNLFISQRESVNHWIMLLNFGKWQQMAGKRQMKTVNNVCFASVWVEDYAAYLEIVWNNDIKGTSRCVNQHTPCSLSLCSIMTRVLVSCGTRIYMWLLLFHNCSCYYQFRYVFLRCIVFEIILEISWRVASWLVRITKNYYCAQNEEGRACSTNG